jgi:hypothetical protein
LANRSRGSGNSAGRSASFEHLADLLLGGAVNPRVGNVCSQCGQMLLLLFQGAELVPLLGVVLHVLHARSTLPLCRGMYGRVGRMTVP